MNKQFMMQYLSKQINVKNFQVADNNLFLLENKKLKVKCDFNIEKEIWFDTTEIHLFDNFLFSGKNFYYDTIKEETEILGDLVGSYFINIYNNAKGLYYNKKIIEYDFNKKQISSHFDLPNNCSPIKLNNEVCLMQGIDFFSCLELKKEVLIWKINFADLLKGKEIMQFGNIHLINNTVYFYLSDNGDSSNYATYKINLSTGKVLNVFEKFGGNLVLANNKLYVANNASVMYLDLDTDIVSKIDLSNKLKEKDLQIHWNSSIVHNNLLVFIDGNWSTTNKFGVIDLAKKELVYNGHLEINDGINNNIQKVVYDNGKLYFHCSDETLHIYEININEA